MKRTLAGIIILCGIALKGTSQSAASIGVDLSFGQKSLPKNGRLGIGASLDYFYPIIQRGGLKATIAYDRFPHNIADPDSALISGIRARTISLLPVRIGWQQFIIPKKLFLAADAGMYRLFSETKYNKFKTGLTYAFSAGYKFQVNKRDFVQLSGLYNVCRQSQFWSYNYFTIRVAYGLAFK